MTWETEEIREIMALARAVVPQEHSTCHSQSDNCSVCGSLLSRVQFSPGSNLVPHSEHFPELFPCPPSLLYVLAL